MPLVLTLLCVGLLRDNQVMLVADAEGMWGCIPTNVHQVLPVKYKNATDRKQFLLTQNVYSVWQPGYAWPGPAGIAYSGSQTL